MKKVKSLQELSQVKKQKPEKTTELFQVVLEKSLIEKVRKIKNKSELTWADLLTYSFNKIIEESDSK